MCVLPTSKQLKVAAGTLVLAFGRWSLCNTDCTDAPTPFWKLDYAASEFTHLAHGRPE